MIYTFQDIQTTLIEIQTHVGSASEFELLIPDRMNDDESVNMAIVSDAILARDWWPDGFSQHDGYRIYKYTDASDA